MKTLLTLAAVALLAVAGCGEKATKPEAEAEAKVEFEWHKPGGTSCINCGYAYVHNTGGKRAVNIQVKTSCDDGRWLISRSDPDELGPDEWGEIDTIYPCNAQTFDVDWIVWD